LSGLFLATIPVLGIALCLAAYFIFTHAGLSKEEAILPWLFMMACVYFIAGTISNIFGLGL
jgi:hypothetical protein